MVIRNQIRHISPVEGAQAYVHHLWDCCIVMMKGMASDDSGRDALSAHHIPGLADNCGEWVFRLVIGASDHFVFILTFPRLESH